ncbi:hypothetical protein CEXT_677651 [Caerostris extrusa]|uniref:Uncharacterized protein n=1 Tax=Caerostris extrusa TaxID=172846 RepID=A0AAV4XBB9_CAEEX|nr:hypothetical protein CEXT_677651 [Caerostris extrusa]
MTHLFKHPRNSAFVDPESDATCEIPITQHAPMIRCSPPRFEKKKPMSRDPLSSARKRLFDKEEKFILIQRPFIFWQYEVIA